MHIFRLNAFIFPGIWIRLTFFMLRLFKSAQIKYLKSVDGHLQTSNIIVFVQKFEINKYKLVLTPEGTSMNAPRCRLKRMKVQ